MCETRAFNTTTNTIWPYISSLLILRCRALFARIYSWIVRILTEWNKRNRWTLLLPFPTCYTLTNTRRSSCKTNLRLYRMQLCCVFIDQYYCEFAHFFNISSAQPSTTMSWIDVKNMMKNITTIIIFRFDFPASGNQTSMLLAK